jgi:hypothetical protein
VDTLRRGSHNAAESGIDKFIAQRHDKRVKAEGRERPLEEAWAESERRYAARRRQELDAAWYGYHMDAAERIERTARRLAKEHRTRAERLLEEGAA